MQQNKFHSNSPRSCFIKAFLRFMCTSIGGIGPHVLVVGGRKLEQKRWRNGLALIAVFVVVERQLLFETPIYTIILLYVLVNDAMKKQTLPRHYICPQAPRSFNKANDFLAAFGQREKWGEGRRQRRGTSLSTRTQNVQDRIVVGYSVT